MRENSASKTRRGCSELEQFGKACSGVLTYKLPLLVPRRRDQRHRAFTPRSSPVQEMARLALLWAAVMPTVGGHATGQKPLAKGQPRARLPRRLEGYSARRLADEDDWTDGPAGFCDGEEAELGETASREVASAPATRRDTKP